MKRICVVSVLCLCTNLISSESRTTPRTALNSYDDFGQDPMSQSPTTRPQQPPLQELETCNQPHPKLPAHVFLNQE